jgi:hypothetical protein
VLRCGVETDDEFGDIGESLSFRFLDALRTGHNKLELKKQKETSE